VFAKGKQFLLLIRHPSVKSRSVLYKIVGYTAMARAGNG
jgi:hypothetical protein